MPCRNSAAPHEQFCDFPAGQIARGAPPCDGPLDLADFFLCHPYSALTDRNFSPPSKFGVFRAFAPSRFRDSLLSLRQKREIAKGRKHEGEWGIPTLTLGPPQGRGPGSP